MIAIKKLINIYWAPIIYYKSACQTFSNVKLLLSLIEFHIVLKRNVKYFSDSRAILYPESEGAKLKFNFTLRKKSKAKDIIRKQSLGCVIISPLEPAEGVNLVEEKSQVYKEKFKTSDAK